MPSGLHSRRVSARIWRPYASGCRGSRRRTHDGAKCGAARAACAAAAARADRARGDRTRESRRRGRARRRAAAARAYADGQTTGTDRRLARRLWARTARARARMAGVRARPSCRGRARGGGGRMSEYDHPDPVDALPITFTTDTAMGHGSPLTRLIVGGQDLTRYCSALTFACMVGEINQAKIPLIAKDGFTFAAPIGLAVVELRTMPGYRLIHERDGDREIWRTEREE